MQLHIYLGELTYTHWSLVGVAIDRRYFGHISANAPSKAMAVGYCPCKVQLDMFQSLRCIFIRTGQLYSARFINFAHTPGGGWCANATEWFGWPLEDRKLRLLRPNRVTQVLRGDLIRAPIGQRSTLYMSIEYHRSPLTGKLIWCAVASGAIFELMVHISVHIIYQSTVYTFIIRYHPFLAVSPSLPQHRPDCTATAPRLPLWTCS